MEHEHCHHEISEKTVNYLLISFVINMLLTVAEIIGGIVAGSISLIGDALHNMSDALSILIAVAAFKIGRRKACGRYTYGFRRAEIVGGFVNLILLFASGVYLIVESGLRLLEPKAIDGEIIIWVSVLALIIDAATAHLSHHGAKHNTNMRMVFVHNLADAMGSVGVIVSGLCVMYLGIYAVDGIVALMIGFYMIYQAVVAFPQTVSILMNAAPEEMDLDKIIRDLEGLEGVESVHHLHVWSISENVPSAECHIVTENIEIANLAAKLLEEKYKIGHCNIQIEKDKSPCCDCKL